MRQLKIEDAAFHLLWKYVNTTGLTLAETVNAIARERLNQSANDLRLTQPRGLLSVQHLVKLPNLQLSPSRFFATTAQRTRFITLFKKSSPEQKMQTLTYSGLSLLDPSLLLDGMPSEQSLQNAWNQLHIIYEGFPDFISDSPQRNLANIIKISYPFHSNIQEKHIVEDFNDAEVIDRLYRAPLETIWLPFEKPSTRDSMLGQQIVSSMVRQNSFIVEDGSDNGQHLVTLMEALKEEEIDVMACGTDIAYHNINLAKFLAKSAGLESSTSFFAAHALHRPNPRSFSKREGQHIILAYRLLPVFNEEKTLRYLQKLGNEMKPGDIWCGSIALPEGSLYEQNIRNHEKIRKYSIRPVTTSFGGTTFLHRPDYGENVSNRELQEVYNERFKETGHTFTEQDFSNVVLNTYMTGTQFENLAKQYGLKFASSPIVADCPDNQRLVVTLEKP